MSLGILHRRSAQRLLRELDPKSKIPVATFIRGFEVEMEHGKTVNWNPYTIGKIVLDHLAERSDYYEMLSRAEAGLGSIWEY